MSPIAVMAIALFCLFLSESNRNCNSPLYVANTTAESESRSNSPYCFSFREQLLFQKGICHDRVNTLAVTALLLVSAFADTVALRAEESPPISLKPMSGPGASSAGHRFLLNEIVGKKQAISYFLNENGLCMVTVMVGDAFIGTDVSDGRPCVSRSRSPSAQVRAWIRRRQFARIRLPGACAGADRQDRQPAADLSVRNVSADRRLRGTTALRGRLRS